MNNRHPLDHPLLWFALVVATCYAIFTYLPFEAMARHPVGQIISVAFLGFVGYTLCFMRAHPRNGPWRR